MAKRSRLRAIRYRAFGMVVLTVALVATACSSQSDEPDSPSTQASGSSSTVDLSGISIASSSVEEMDVLRFNGFNPDDDLSSLELKFLVDGLDPMDLLLFADETGIFAVAPLHPVAPGSGGDVTFQLSIGEDQSQAFEVAMTGIPKAPGAWDAAVDSLLDELEARAGQLGTNLSDISASNMASLGDDAAAIKFIAGFIDDGSSEDIGSLLVRPGEELSADQVGLVDSVVAKLDLGRLNLPTLEVPTASALKASGRTGSVGAPNTHVNAVRASLAQATSCRRKVITISDGSDLQRELAEGIAARSALQDGHFSDSSDYVVSNGLMLTGMAAGAFAATGVGAPAAGVVASVGTVAGAMYATKRLTLMVDAASYPTSFASLEVDVSETEFNEDFEKDGIVNDVKVVASATGFDGAQALAGLAASVADGALGIAAGGLKTSDRMGEIIGGTMGASGGIRGTAQAKAIESLSGDTFKICPQQWTVSIKDSKYVRAWTVDGRIEVNAGTFDYKPTEVGGDTLWMETLPEAFPGASAISETPIETYELEVDSNPKLIKIRKAGDPVQITAILENADNWDLAWETTGGTWTDRLGEVTESRETSRQLKTPSNTKLYPVTVTVTSLSESGLRKDGPERYVEVEIELRNLIVDPDPGGVLVKEDQQFTATDSDGQPRDVTWTATGGSIESSGLYTAYDKPGAYTVTATATDDPSITETVVVNVVDQCLVGTWLLRSQEFFDQVGAQAGGETKYRSGESRLVIREDGTYTTYRDAWSFSVAAEGGTIVGIIDAENSGMWQATDVEMIIEDAGGDEETVQLFIEIGGQLQTLPIGGSEFTFASDSFSGEIPYSCKDDVLTATAGGVTSISDRVDG